mgnify:CR=1 FL=1
MDDTYLRKKWSKLASDLLVGRKIVKVRYMTNEEQENHMWSRKSVVIHLDNGVIIYPSADDEGNDAGAIFTTQGELSVLPVI